VELEVFIQLTEDPTEDPGMSKKIDGKTIPLVPVVVFLMPLLKETVTLLVVTVVLVWLLFPVDWTHV